MNGTSDRVGCARDWFNGCLAAGLSSLAGRLLAVGHGAVGCPAAAVWQLALARPTRSTSLSLLASAPAAAFSLLGDEAPAGPCVAVVEDSTSDGMLLGARLCARPGGGAEIFAALAAAAVCFFAAEMRSQSPSESETAFAATAGLLFAGPAGATEEQTGGAGRGLRRTVSCRACLAAATRSISLSVVECRPSMLGDTDWRRQRAAGGAGWLREVWPGPRSVVQGN